MKRGLERLARHSVVASRWLAGMALTLVLAMPSMTATAQTYPDPLDNTATVTVPEGMEDPDPSNNSATDSNTLQAEADLSMIKTLLSPSPAPAGSTVVYQLVVSNAGPSVAVDARVADTVPPELGNVSWTCTPGSAASSCAQAAGTGAVDVLVTVAAGDTISITIEGTAPSTTPSTIGENSATVTPPPGTTDPNPGDNTGTVPPVDVEPLPIIANDDAYGPINGSIGGTSIGNVLDNDTLNGQPVDPADITLAPVTEGPITINANGSVDLAPGTPAGTYTATYQICEVLNPNNCDTAIVTVEVAAGELVANDDAFGPINGSQGGTTPSVLGNDTLNGVPVDPADVTLGEVTPDPAGALALNPDGTITVAPGTPAGSYTLTYQICENLNPDNCDTAVVTATVEAAVLDAVDDSFGPVDGRQGGTNVGNVLDNDTLNGQPVDPAAITATMVGELPPELTFNLATGVVGVNPDTPAGIYSFTYQICENLNPDNCDTATVSVAVTAVTLLAMDDSYGPANGSDGNPNLGSVFDNDTMNGTPVDPAAITATMVGELPPELTFNLATGVVGVNPDTPAGIYTFTYQICENLNPDNCDTAVVTVTIEAAVLDAVDDSFGPVDGRQGGTNAGNVLDNDTLNGVPVDPADVTLSEVTPDPTGALTLNPDGTITVAPGTPAGSYTLTYQICENLNPDNCDTALATVEVAAAELIANDDNFGPATGSTGNPNVGNVFGNDMLNDQPVDPADITATVVGDLPPELTFNLATGVVGVNPDTPAGIYTFTYQICENFNPDNCDTATVTVQVAAGELVANDDSFGPVDGRQGGTNVGNVLDNDTLNGQPVDPADITLAPVTEGPITINADGSVDIAPGTPAGTYPATYQICENLNPDNCNTAVVTATVEAAVIDAVDNSFGPVDGRQGGTNVGNVLDNDTLDGQPVDPADITLAPVTEGPITINADGSVDIVPGTPAGTYTVTYQICEVLNPSNCDTAIVTVEVAAGELVANDDSFGVETTQNTPVTVDVLGNDTRDGGTIDPGTVMVTIETEPIHGTVVVNPDGSITYTPGENFSGTDSFTYQICEVANPDNCAIATVTVTVQPNNLQLVDDHVETDQDAVTIDVLANDTTTGAPLDPGTLTIVDPPAHGTVTCSAGECTYTPEEGFAGSEGFTYQVCDVSVPEPVCGTARVQIQANDRAAQLRLVKQAGARTMRVGVLVRYTVIAENVGDVPARDVYFIDTPPPGFSYVDGSLVVDSKDDSARVTSTNPLRIEGIDVAIGSRATLAYYMHVGAGVGAGVFRNVIIGFDGNDRPISNEASAEVEVAGDPLLDDSLVLGTAFDDRDGDGWQDPAKATGVHMQGGFAPGAYVAHSTTVDRGAGPEPEPDASLSLLHGIVVGTIGGRSSSADPVERQQVVVRQRLNELRFTDDFMLTTAEGTTLRMNAAGKTTLERGGVAGKGLTGQDLAVSREVSQVAGGYEVSYVIRNHGIDERGMPGVRIATVEGVLMETDAHGRYHLIGVHGGHFARGRNFILKVDPSTLPPGSMFTTPNPLVRRIIQGVPTRFDFGVSLPAGALPAPAESIDVELGEALFVPGSAQIEEAHAPLFATIATRLHEAGGGRIAITARTEQEALAFDRARAVQEQLQQQLDPELARHVSIAVMAEAVPDSELVSLGKVIRLGEFLFDTDSSVIRPRYGPLIDQVAEAINRDGRGVIGLVGHADPRGGNDYNARLGLRRAKAVYGAIAARLKPEIRPKLRVVITDATTAPLDMDLE